MHKCVQWNNQLEMKKLIIFIDLSVFLSHPCLQLPVPNSREGLNCRAIVFTKILPVQGRKFQVDSINAPILRTFFFVPLRGELKGDFKNLRLPFHTLNSE